MFKETIVLTKINLFDLVNKVPNITEKCLKED